MAGFIRMVCDQSIQFVHSLSQYDALTSLQLKRLLEHKYSASDTSFLDQLCMQKFWNWFVNFYPLWLAPNLITLLGLICNVAAALILAYYSPDGKQAAPCWSYFLCALGLFAYQTLDATDGKQARRTKSNSCLGELFDHGCDSLSQVFVTLEACLALQLGEYPRVLLYVCLFSMAVFYCAHWQTYCCGTLKFSSFDVTEAQFCIIFVCLISSIFGPQIWAKEILGYELKLILIGGCTLGAMYQSYWYLNVVFTGGVGKNGTTIADTSVIFPVLPLLTALIPSLVMYQKSHGGVFEEHLVFYCITFGLVATKITNRLIIAHMSKSELYMLDSILFGPLLVLANQYFDRIFPEYIVLIFCFTYCAINLLCYCVTVCQQMAECLHVKVFTIPPVDVLRQLSHSGTPDKRDKH